MFTVETSCRSCGSSRLKKVIDFGWTPLADRLPTREELDRPEPSAPLDLVVCEECSLAQITTTVDPEILFCDSYPYYSSVSPSLMAHFKESAVAIMEERKLGADSLVVEAASNDGYMLRNFVAEGIPVLGIDPADGPAAKAQEAGVETMNTFFTKALAEQLRSDGKAADVFLANNVLAHVPDLNGFVGGIATVLKDDGVAVMEAPYLVDLVDKCEFDTIYHQHLCYYSITALDGLFRRNRLFLNDVKRTSIHGGSLRLFVGKADTPTETVGRMIEQERAAGMTDASYCERFAARVVDIREKLSAILWDLKMKGASVAGYGAAAKATTLLSWARIDKRQLDFIADLNPIKHGRYMSINHLPIVPPGALLERRPDYVVLLAWNFKDEIMRQQKEYTDGGGRFIVPVPDPQIL